MKRISIQLAALALALLLSACASQSPAPQTPAEEPESPQATLTGRIVSVQESTVLLAGQEDSGLSAYLYLRPVHSLDAGRCGLRSAGPGRFRSPRRLSGGRPCHRCL